MKQRIPDQAEKLRQLAAEDKAKSTGKDTETPVLEPSPVSKKTDTLPSAGAAVVTPEIRPTPEKIVAKESSIKETEPATQKKSKKLSNFKIIKEIPRSPIINKERKAKVENKTKADKPKSNPTVTEAEKTAIENIVTGNTVSDKQENASVSEDPKKDDTPKTTTETTKTADADTQTVKPDSTKKVDTPQKAPSENTADTKIQPKSQKSPTVITPSTFQKKRLPVEKQTKVIAISGGKGGVGKSNIACNLGIAMTAMNKQVMLIDADLSLANLDVLLGITPRVNLSHVINGEKKLEDIIVRGPNNLSIVPGGSGLEELANIKAEKMEHLFNAFNHLSPPPDVLLIDTAAGIHPNVLQFLLAADQVILVTTPEPTAYTDAYALLKTLVRHNADQEIGILVNMAQDVGEAREVIKLLLQICKQMLHTQFNNIGWIPRDPNVAKAVRHQKPFTLLYPGTPASKAVQHIASTILQIENKQSPPRGIGNFIRRLFGHKKPEAMASSS